MKGIEAERNRVLPTLAGGSMTRRKNSVSTELERQNSLDECDLWIAATALALDAILVTSDSNYQRIAGLGLRLEDWAN